MTTIALLLAAIAVATPEPGFTGPTGPAATAVPAEMTPAPGRWEVEDAPAYFSARTDIRGAPAPGAPASAGRAVEAWEGAALVARRRP